MRARKQQEALRAEQERVCSLDAAYNFALAWLCWLDRLSADYRPKALEEAFHPLYAYALHNLPAAREAAEIAEYERNMIWRRHDQPMLKTIKYS